MLMDERDELETKVLSNIAEDAITVLKHLKKEAKKQHYYLSLEWSRRQVMLDDTDVPNSSDFTWVLKMLKDVYEHFLLSVEKIRKSKKLSLGTNPQPQGSDAKPGENSSTETKPEAPCSIMKSLNLNILMDTLDLTKELDALASTSKREPNAEMIQAQLAELESVD